ncbi:MAG: SDR family oxidoreductase [Rhodocyclaceae bacterium]
MGWDMIKAVVTGHSRGLGAAIAGALMARGIAVMGLARRGLAVDEGGIEGGTALKPADAFVQVGLDLGDPVALARWLEGGELAAFLAGSDTALLVNNAGTLQPMGGLDQQLAVDVARAVTLNVAAPLALAAGFVGATRHVPDKRIVHVSSGAARNAYPGWSVYCATKAALDQHARAVTLDATPGVRICSLAPGVIDTTMQAEIRATPLARFPRRARFEELHRDGGLEAPAAVADKLVAYLLDDAFGRVPVADLRDLA